MGHRNPVELAASASSNRGIRALLGALVAAVVAGAGYFVWRRSRSTSEDPVEHKWAPPTPAPDAAFQPGMADLDSPDVVDEEFAAEVDSQADELAEEMVDSIEAPGQEHRAAAAEQPAEAEFQPGMADLDSPDVVDEEFAAEVDAEADELAEEIVDSIDESKQ
ncbi:MAG: hypothetical protein WCF36_19115 [Candidatus Nanopelagicales bacterium]